MRKSFALMALAAMLPTMTIAQSETPSNEVIKTIMERRSVRKYLDKPVEHEKLAVVVKCGINAPNGMNSQKWQIRVVEDSKWISGVTEVFKKANPDMVKRDPNFKNMFRNAPNIICIATPAKGGADIDAGLAGENMIIAAQSLGLGTCCLGGPVRFLATSEEARPYMEKLELPDDYKISYIIAIGYPDEKPDAKPRDESKVKYIK